MEKEEIEQLICQGVNPKLMNKLEDLKRNRPFLDNIEVLRVKWADLIKVSIFGFDKIDEIWGPVAEKEYKKTKNLPVHIPLEKIKEASVFFKDAFMPFTNKDFLDDIVLICKKYKIYPIKYWQWSIMMWVIQGDRITPHFFLKTGLYPHFSVEETQKIPNNMYFGLSVEKNKETEELELKVQSFEDTSKRDVSENWGEIKKYETLLRDKKGITIKYKYRNLEVAKKLEKLDIETYYDPSDNKEHKLTDRDKIFSLDEYENDNVLKEEDKKRLNRLRVIRHRDKKRKIT